MTSCADPSSIAAKPSAAGRAAALNAGRKVWIDGEYVEQSRASVSVFDHGFLYGDGCFEGIRAYNGRIFKLGSHIARLFRSAQKIRLEPAYSRDAIERAVRETVAANGLNDAYIRLVLTRGVGSLGLHPFKCAKSGTIIIADEIELYPPAMYETGMKVIVAKRPRIPVECLDPSVKSLNYLNNILAKVEAIDQGVPEAIMLNVDGWVSECTGDNIFVVKDGQLATPAEQAGFLHGITRRFVIDEIGPSCGRRVDEKMMRLEEILGADEVFLTGTAAEIIAVTQVDETVIGDGRIGPVTRELSEEFRRRVSENAPED